MKKQQKTHRKKAWIVVSIVLLIGILALFRLQMESSIPECAGQRRYESDCWYEAIDYTLRRKGLSEAFEVLADIYQHEPSFSQACHDITHRLGNEAYRLFARGKTFRVSPNTAYCSYGFYHGFMEYLASRDGDLSKAQEFCEQVDTQISEVSPDASLQCFHGIGHGTVNNHDPAYWGNEVAMVGEALRLCDEVSANYDQLSRCATGAYNGLALFYIAGEYNLSVNPQDPFAICRIAEERFQDACYISLNVTLLWLTQGDFDKAAQFVEDIPDDVMAQHAILNLAAPVGTKNMNNSDHSQMIKACRGLQDRLHLSCIQGYGYGFLEHGTPQEEYVGALEFCKSDSLLEDEQTACLSYIYEYLPQWYQKEKVYEICSIQESEKLQTFCLESVQSRYEHEEKI